MTQDKAYYLIAVAILALIKDHKVEQDKIKQKIYGLIEDIDLYNRKTDGDYYA